VQLWRYPVGASTPTQIGVPPIFDGSYLSYSSEPVPVSNSDGVLGLWSTHDSNAQTSLILLKWESLH
jgi:hypothetical protein